MTDARFKLVLQFVLAALYSFGLFLIAVLAFIFWDKFSKVDVGLATMLLASFMNQSKDAGTFFFSPHAKAGDSGGPFVPSEKP